MYPYRITCTWWEYRPTIRHGRPVTADVRKHKTIDVVAACGTEASKLALEQVPAGAQVANLWRTDI